MTHSPAPVRKKPGRHRILVQATVRPVDADGRVAFGLGTLVFAVATLVCWLNRATLRAHHSEWWVAVCLTGVAVGALALAYCWWRLRRPQSKSD